MTPSESCLTQIAQPPAYRQMLTAVGNFYCRFFHRAISRPVRGRYHCWKCLRQFELDW